MVLTAGGLRRGEQLGWRHTPLTVMDRLPGQQDPLSVAPGPRPAPAGDLVQPDPTGDPGELAPGIAPHGEARR